MFRLFLPAIAIAFAAALLPHPRAADTKPIEPFNGKDLKGWKLRNEKQSNWVVANGYSRGVGPEEHEPVRHHWRV